MQLWSKIEAKIVTADDLAGRLAVARPRCVAFTNGCFDILHQGHLNYLARSRSMADMLVVGLNSDASVRRLKGEGRPVNDERSRALMLASLEAVDYVVLFEEDTPYNLIKAVQPDLLVKGGDYDPSAIVGHDIVEARGGRVVALDFIPGFSTTNIINKLKK
ncbi:MAG: D-glycero-beta-D-manno-heptose 1-phosphate adenylyltransferase [Bacteroidales bacterium]|nr:D-glycero-beta-D-manno-heptose 1-phosphate adenylyltransferase [Bacteroidales bacterium]